jgi:hypothetical protein
LSIGVLITFIVILPLDDAQKRPLIITILLLLVGFFLAILNKKQRTMPLPLITSRDSFIDSLQDAPSSTTAALHQGVSPPSTDSHGDKIGSAHTIAKTPSSCDSKQDHHHNSAASEVVVQQTMSTSLQSSTLSDSCSDDFVNEPMHSPPTPPTELKTDLDGNFETNETLLSGEPDIPIVLDGGEEDQLSVTMLALYKVNMHARTNKDRHYSFPGHGLERHTNTL